jgi:hypothetical protein
MDQTGTRCKDMMKNNYVRLGLCCLVAFIFSGCLQNYGRLHWDPQVTADFQTYTALKNLNYYHYGIGNRTFAIAGVSAEYHMKSRMWREVPDDNEVFKGLVSRAWINHAYRPYDPKGAYILDPQGKQVGTWYSSLRFVTVKFAENNRIVLMPDTPFLGGPEASNGDDFGERISRFESNPYISYQLKALFATQ